MTSAEYWFHEGCYVTEWHNSADDPDMSVAHIRVLPGTTTKLHGLRDTVERYVILQGQGEVTVASRSWQVVAADVVVIKPGEAQKICNTGAEDLRFLAICAPRFEECNYQPLQE